MYSSMEDFFEDIVLDVKDYVLREAKPSRVLDETADREGSLTMSIGSSLFGSSMDSGMIKDLARDAVDDVAYGLIDEQKRAVVQAAELKADDDFDQQAYQELREEFVQGLAEFTSELNRPVHRGLEERMYDRFDDVTDHVAYYKQTEGDDFVEKVENTPREESEERLYDLVEYIGDIETVFQGCDRVYAELDSPIGRRNFHMRQEGLRLLRKSRDRVEGRVEDVLDEAYGDAA